MKLSVAERVAMNITVALLLIVAAFYAGRNTVTGSVVVETAIPESTAYVYSYTESSISEVSEVQIASSSAPSDVLSAEEADSVDEDKLWTVESDELLNLNLAVQEELESLPGIGPVLAERIISYRNSVGMFHSIEELKNVDGIGDKIYSSISEYLKVDEYYENSGS